MINFKVEVPKAEARIRPYLRETPLDYSLPLSEWGGSRAYVKLENLQHTGSFKARGALNAMLSLGLEERAKGVVAASTGNHGAAVAFGLHRLGMKGIIFVPENASPTKLDAIRRYGAEVRLFGNDGLVTEVHARRYAEHRGMTYLSPYNDPRVIAGQATIGAELYRQLPSVEVVFVALGGGGLISGIAGYLKAMSPGTLVVGCSPSQAPIMYASIQAGHVVEMESKPTLSDGTAGGLEPESVTFALCRALIDEHCLVREAEIREAMLLFMESHHMMIEGAAGVAIAAYLKMKERFRDKNVALIICGANISLDTLRSIL